MSKNRTVGSLKTNASATTTDEQSSQTATDNTETQVADTTDQSSTDLTDVTTTTVDADTVTSTDTLADPEQPVVTASATTTDSGTTTTGSYFDDAVLNDYVTLYLEHFKARIPNIKAAIKDLNIIIKRVVNADTNTAYEGLLKFFIDYKSSLFTESSALQGASSLSPTDFSRISMVYTTMRAVSTDSVPKGGFDLDIVEKTVKSTNYRLWLKKKMK